MEDIKTEIGKEITKLVSPKFIMGDTSTMIKDIYNKLDLIIDEINKLKAIK